MLGIFSATWASLHFFKNWWSIQLILYWLWCWWWWGAGYFFWQEKGVRREKITNCLDSPDHTTDSQIDKLYFWTILKFGKVCHRTCGRIDLFLFMDLFSYSSSEPSEKSSQNKNSYPLGWWKSKSVCFLNFIAQCLFRAWSLVKNWMMINIDLCSHTIHISYGFA